ncbi:MULTISPECIES: hypothetical protein [unclassified Myroides]|uniref:hypothetical protein n=1 Tax=unclassified Myroides TaxID=2642485 RepID=UPI0031012DB6
MRYILAFFLFSLCVFSQNDNSINKLTVSAGFQGIEMTYGLNLTEEIALGTSIGLGGGYSIEDQHLEYKINFSEYIPFLKSNLGWYYNERKNNYVSFQTKYSFGRGSDVDYNKLILNEIHWGMNRKISKNVLFNFHLGFGDAYDFDTKSNRITPTIGVTLKYSIL